MIQKKEACIKCGYTEKLRQKSGFLLCEICFSFAPDSETELKKYVLEKIDGSCLTSFRKYSSAKGENQKKAMLKKASGGVLMSRSPFGYKLENGQLVPGENFKEIEEIFEEFLTTNISLNQLAKKHNLSVNGLKKILTNFTYIGKIKFNNQVYEGKHQPIISSTLFNHVQNKLERLRTK